MVEVGKSVSSKTARRVAVVISLIVGVIFGSQFNANWSEILLMFNAQSFGTTDPQFGLDNGFYVFVLPGLKLVLAAVAMLLGVGLVFSVVTHVLMGGIRITMPVNGRGLFSITKRCRRQLGIWLMLNMFAWAVRQMIGVFDQLTVQGSRITGASYTAVHANIPRHLHHGRADRHPRRGAGHLAHAFPHARRPGVHRRARLRRAQGLACAR